MSSKINRVLIANRAEIAIRVARTLRRRGQHSVAIYSPEDTDSRHIAHADQQQSLPGRGAAAYLDIAAVIEAALASGADSVHPGYGFLSERSDFAEAIQQAGLTFVGPSASAMSTFADKSAARALAQRCGVPVIPGVDSAGGIEAVQTLLANHGAIMLKAAAGGGGRGMRIVREAGALEDAWQQASREAELGFGDGTLFAEAYVESARHIEIQIVADHYGDVVALGERECSLQRRHQKLIEIAPAVGISDHLRQSLADAAVTLAKAVSYSNLGTFEFLVTEDERFYFIEANARLQVEHTVTEEIFDVDLVAIQLDIAAGARLFELNLPASSAGCAIQARINMERLTDDGRVLPSSGRLDAFEMPGGSGVRVDTFGFTGFATTPVFDSLLAKVICRGRTYADAINQLRQALAETRIEGVQTNTALLLELLAMPEVVSGRMTTQLVDDNLGAIAKRLADANRSSRPAAGQVDISTAPARGDDPLAVLEHGRELNKRVNTAPTSEDSKDPWQVPAPMQGTVVSVLVSPGDEVPAGGVLLVMEAMKMEHEITAPHSGTVEACLVADGAAVSDGSALVRLRPSDVTAKNQANEVSLDLDAIRDDLAEVIERHHIGLDEARPDAVAKRAKQGQRTARANLDDLIDAGSMIEYAPLVVAAQRRRRSLDDLIRKTPADGMVSGVAQINGAQFPGRASQCVVMSYDYTVLAGTQGSQNHRKKDRLFEIAEHNRLPVVFFTEGGGGRPGDTDGIGVAGLDCLAFQYFAKLSGLVPLVGINSGRCFAGNAALLGCCDVVIATKSSNIGMGGPAMIEGGGLGIYTPDEVGPMSVQVANGVVDIEVEDYAEAVAVAKQYLSYFQGEIEPAGCADQRLLRHLIPENRLRVYDVRRVIETLADTGSVLELRRGFGLGMVTSLARIDGKPIGIIANNPHHLAGAIDSDAADKASRFMQLCDAFDLPLLFLCDTPGIMVGPEVEKTALVRHAARMFVTAASLSVPFFTIVLRKGYGLGAQAMAGGSFKAPMFTVAWPTGEFGGMGLEGAVKLGYRNELAAIEEPEARKAKFDEMVERMYRHGRAVSTADHFEIDDVIDPKDSRHWLSRGLAAAPLPEPRTGKKRPCIDTW